MRLRALRVVVDVRLAIGELDIDGAAAAIWRRRSRWTATTAREEAAFFAATPGQAMTYQIGKTQILRLLADAVRAQGRTSTCRPSTTGCGWRATCPLALQRWELLDDRAS